MIWIILVIVGIIVIKFLTDMNNDTNDLGGESAAEKFEVIVEQLNNHVFHGKGKVIKDGIKFFKLYDGESNQIIEFQYNTGTLHITWKYKYFQKEVVRTQKFREVNNLSILQQQKIAEQMIKEMEVVVLNHMNNVMKDI
jgi:hypothetical protein